MLTLIRYALQDRDTRLAALVFIPTMIAGLYGFAGVTP